MPRPERQGARISRAPSPSGTTTIADAVRICWRRIDRPGHEAAELRRVDDEWRLRGVVVLVSESQPSALEYEVICDASWRTTRATVTSLLDERRKTLELRRAPSGGWRVDGAERPELAGCTDVDLGFTPSTNLLPIRRLGLESGAEAAVRAAWVRFPGLTVEILDQVYRRTGANTYRYESAGGAFTRQLEVDQNGLVVDYPGIWTRE